MKYIRFFIGFTLFLTVIMSGCSVPKRLTKEEKIAQEALLRAAIENRTFIVEVDRALPMSGSSRMLTSPYTLQLNGDEVKSYLPYFGRAYSVPYGGGEGLIFESTVTDYQCSFDKKGKATIEFKTRSKDDQFIYLIHIFADGSSSMNVTSTNRQPISFNGKSYAKKE